MGNMQPYRHALDATQAITTPPRSVVIGVSFGAWAFAVSVVLWLVNHFAVQPESGMGRYMMPAYAWTCRIALLLTAAICSWKPMPGSRSHFFARLATIGWIVGLVSEFRQADPCGSSDALEAVAGSALGESVGRLVLWLSLAGLVVSAGRRFALPRWAPIIGAGVASALVGPTWTRLLHDDRTSFVAFFPVSSSRALSLAELVVLVSFCLGFARVAYAARRRPFLDEEVLVSPSSVPNDRELHALAPQATTSILLSGFVFVLANLAGTGASFVPPAVNAWEIATQSSVPGFVVLVVLVEYARRKARATSSVALTVAAAIATVFAAVSAFASNARRAAISADLALLGLVFLMSGVALLLPDIPRLARDRAKVRVALVSGSVCLGLSIAADVSTRDPHGVTTFTACGWRGTELLFLAASLFAVLALHFSRAVEREALIASAILARR